MKFEGELEKEGIVIPRFQGEEIFFYLLCFDARSPGIKRGY